MTYFSLDFGNGAILEVEFAGDAATVFAWCLATQSIADA